MKGFSIYMIVFLLTVIGCTKDQTIFIPDTTDKVSQEYFHNLVSNTSTLTTVNIVADQETTVFSQDKFFLRIPANSLLNEDGEPITGSIKLDIHNNTDDKSDFIITPSLIFDKNLAKSSNTYTISFIENVKISKPIELYLTLDQTLISDKPLQLYTVDKNQKWILALNNVNTDTYQIPLAEKNIKITGAKLLLSNRANVLSLLSKDIATTQYSLCINVDKKFNALNTLAYFISNNGKHHIKLDNVGGQQFCSPTFGIRDQLEGHIVVLSDTGNESYHFGLQNASFSSSQTIIDVAMLPSHIQEIKAAIQSL
jgi:hypothetical protein